MTDRMIPMADMEDRRLYRIYSRNLVVGIWDAQKNGIVGIREKFGARYPFVEYHREVGPPVGTVAPERALDAWAPADLSLDEYGSLAGIRALMTFLEPYQAQIEQEIAEERAAEALERESKKWAPPTFEEHLKEVNRQAVSDWWRNRPEREYSRLDWSAMTAAMSEHHRLAYAAARRGETYTPHGYPYEQDREES